MRLASRDLWEKESPEWLVFAVVISLLLHAFLAWKLPLNDALSPEPSSEAPIEVERFTDRDLPVVRSSRLEDQEKLDDKKARFGAERRNRVREETRAARTGRFQEGAQAPGVESGALPDAKTGEGVLPRLGMRDLLPPSISASPNALPRDLRVGRETLLNTDPVRFAGFLNRIADEIYDPWVRLVRGALDDLRKSESQIGEGEYITRVGVWMNHEGEVTKIEVIQASGVPVFDEAVKQAFWETEPFPHPPAQLFEKEDPVRFAYEFHVSLSGSLSVRPFRM